MTALVVILASFRLTEIITMDRIGAPLREFLKRKSITGRWWWDWSYYLVTCPRCVSVSAALLCYLAFPRVLNIALAISWLTIVQLDFRGKSKAEIENRAHIEVERMALQMRDNERRDLEAAYALKARGFIMPPGSQR